MPQRSIVMNMSSLLSSFVALVAVYLSATPSEALPNTFVASNGTGSTCSRVAPCADFQTAHNATNDGGDITCVDAGNYAPAGGFDLFITKSITIDCGGTAGMYVFSSMNITGSGIVV